jgi:hypothetical protein
MNGQRGCDSCYALLADEIPLLQKPTAFTAYKRNGTSSRVTLCVNDGGNLLQLDTVDASSSSSSSSSRSRGGSNTSSFNDCSDEFSFDDYTTVIDGQQSISFRAAVGAREPGLLSCCFGSTQDIRVYAPSCFSLSFGGDVLDLQADSPALKADWMGAFQSYATFYGSAAGRVFAPVRQQKYRQVAQASAASVEQAERAERARQSRAAARDKADSIRSKWRERSASSSSTAGYRVEKLDLDDL